MKLYHPQYPSHTPVKVMKDFSQNMNKTFLSAYEIFNTSLNFLCPEPWWIKVGIRALEKIDKFLMNIIKAITLINVDELKVCICIFLIVQFNKCS